jgi:hypothetical protein
VLPFPAYPPATLARRVLSCDQHGMCCPREGAAGLMVTVVVLFLVVLVAGSLSKTEAAPSGFLDPGAADGVACAYRSASGYVNIPVGSASCLPQRIAGWVLTLVLSVGLAFMVTGAWRCGQLLFPGPSAAWRGYRTRFIAVLLL